MASEMSRRSLRIAAASLYFARPMESPITYWKSCDHGIYDFLYIESNIRMFMLMCEDNFDTDAIDLYVLVDLKQYC